MSTIGSLPLTRLRGIFWDGERERVRRNLRVSDPAVPVGSPDADGVVQVCQMVWLLGVIDGAPVIEAPDLAGSLEEILKAADGGWKNCT